MSRHISVFNRLRIGSAIVLATMLLAIMYRGDFFSRGFFNLYGECYRWIPSLVALHVVSDTAIGFAYLFISIVLFISLRLLHLPFQSVFIAFGAFSICCTVTHFIEVITTLWVPLYWFAGSLKLLTAIVSVWTALLLPPLIPKVRDTLADAKLAQEQSREIAERDEQYTALANAMPLLVLTGNARGRVNFFNTMWKSYTGCNAQELLEGLRKGSFTHPDDYHRVGADWQLQTQQGNAFEYELRIKRYDGAYRWHLIHMTPIYERDGMTRQWIGTGTDIHKQKRNEQTLRENQLRQDTFLTMVSHELKTPLTSIQLLVSFLRNEITSSKYERALATIENQLQRIIQLVNDLLDMSRIKAGQLSFIFASCDAIAIAREAIARVQVSSETHKLIVVCGTTAQVYADPDRLAQVMINLLTNAIKYSPEADHVDIRVTVNEHSFQFAVQDSGIGMSQEAQTHIFEQYYRNIEASHQKYAGLGIGLYTASEIVKCHHGEIWVASDEGQGSTFTFSLPLEKRDNASRA